MATTVKINDRGQTAKIRNPMGVVALSFVTLGIYYLVWYYKINREMRDWGTQTGRDIGSSPGMSLLAITLGSCLIVPPFISVWATGKRMRLAQQAAGVSGGSGAIWFVLSIIPLVNLLAPAYMQAQLNRAWETRPGNAFGAAVPATA